jgi:hypothetical protein
MDEAVKPDLAINIILNIFIDIKVLNFCLHNIHGCPVTLVPLGQYSQIILGM